MENKLNEAIFNVIHDIEAIKKDTQGFGYKYATLTSVLEALKKPCKDNNIYFLQIPKTDYVSMIETKEKIKINKGKNNIEENIVDVRKAIATVSLITKIVHKDSGETMKYVSSCMVEEATDPQKIGSAITYLRRYALVSIFAMEQEDDDGNSAKNRENKKEDKKEDKKINNESNYNSQKDVYEHKVDYNIVPFGDNKGKRWIDLDNKTLSVAYEYLNKKNMKEYLIVVENILKVRKEVEEKQKAIQVNENEDPYKNANDKNWDTFLIDDSETNTTETVENTNNFNSDDDNGNPFGDDSHIDFGEKK